MTDFDYLQMAARLAIRGHGGAEPNPLVGCVIVRDADVVGWGYHQRCGGPHAEVHALQRAGDRAAGATVYVTLEPCNHDGRTGPCTEALIDAGVGRVVYATPDPSVGAGGAERLRTAGISVEHVRSCHAAVEVSRPFVHRVRTGLPWVIAKWAQTIDGRIATRAGESKWISNAASRRVVHTKRARVDAILAGIGTVLSDDPMLTARGVRVSRVARRVIIDPRLEIPVDSRLVGTAGRYPTTVAVSAGRLAEARDKADTLRGKGVELIVLGEGEESLAVLLRELVATHEVSTVLCEGGAGLLGRLFKAGLVGEAWVFIAPLLLGDDEALPCVRGMSVTNLTHGRHLELFNVRRRGEDVLLQYGVTGRWRGRPR